MITALAIVAVYGLIAFRGPQGIPALVEKRKQIRELQEANADLIRENESKRKRLEILQGRGTSELDREIRDRLKKMRPGETEYVLPETPAPIQP